MSLIIAFGNQKGGVGKSTIITLCANALAQPPFQLKICVVDNDPQRSIYEARQFDLDGKPTAAKVPYDVLAMDLKTLQEHIYELDKQYDLVLIDTAGRLDVNLDVQQQEITKVLMYADWLFVPFRAGNFNLDASLEYLKMAAKLQQLRANSPRPLRFYGFVNMFKDRSNSNFHLVEEIENLRTAGVKFMLCRLRNYAAFEEIDTFANLYDVNANDKAKLNFTVWLNEFVKILKDG